MKAPPPKQQQPISSFPTILINTMKLRNAQEVRTHGVHGDDTVPADAVKAPAVNEYGIVMAESNKGSSWRDGGSTINTHLALGESK